MKLQSMIKDKRRHLSKLANKTLLQRILPDTSFKIAIWTGFFVGATFAAYTLSKKRSWLWDDISWWSIHQRNYDS
jgi:hypothetical protein